MAQGTRASPRPGRFLTIQGYSEAVIRATLALVILGVLFVPLEKLRPVRSGQRFRRPGLRTDVIHFLVTGTLGTIALVILAVVIALPMQRLTPDSLRHEVTAQPQVLQLIAALLIIEFTGYWAHRAHHRIPALWKLHRVHHSSVRMDWLAAAHLHPFDSTIVLLQLHAIFQHASFRTHSGTLGQLVSSPHFHHWHHSGDLEARDKNFAGMFPWLDRVFATYHAPTHAWPQTYGIDDPMPAGYLRQLQSPFVASEPVPA